MTNGYAADQGDVETIAQAAIGDILAEPDPTIRYVQLGAAGALYAALATRIANEKARCAAQLAGQGLSLTEVAAALSLGTKARAQQLVSRGRALESGS